MDWLQSLDTELFRFLNLRLVNPFLDVVLPLASGNPLFRPVLLLAGILLLWKGRARGLVCVLMLALILPLGDGLICNTLKHALGRPRPFMVMPDVHRPGINPDAAAMVPSAMTEAEKPKPPSEAKGDYASMPSSHAANWFAATMILYLYYRRTLWFMLPAAILVSFSRIYNGVHYPGDVLVAAVLGAGYAAASVWSLHALWQWAGPKWFPLWWCRFPSLLNPALLPRAEEGEEAPAPSGSAHATLDQHWLRLGYCVLALLLLVRLAYIGSATIQLSRDEAYQWLWFPPSPTRFMPSFQSPVPINGRP